MVILSVLLLVWCWRLSSQSQHEEQVAVVPVLPWFEAPQWPVLDDWSESQEVWEESDTSDFDDLLVWWGWEQADEQWSFDPELFYDEEIDDLLFYFESLVRG